MGHFESSYQQWHVQLYIRCWYLTVNNTIENVETKIMRMLAENYKVVIRLNDVSLPSYCTR